MFRSQPKQTQPGTFHFNNTFLPQAGENMQTVFECQEGCCDCCGRKTTVALTNARLISRIQEPCPCCCCCCQGRHYDKTIFLKDISILREVTGGTGPGCLVLLLSCLTGQCLCLLCASCCGDTPKSLGFEGGYGSDILTFSTKDYMNAVNAITATTLRHKSR